MEVNEKNWKVKKIKKLISNPKKYFQEFEEIIVETKNVIDLAISKKVLVFLLTTNKNIVDNKKYFLINQNLLAKISTLKTPNQSIGIAKLPKFNQKNQKTICFFEKINDPGNLGTILRTSLAFEIDTIYLSKGSVFPYSPKVVNSSQGAIFDLKITFIDYQELKKKYPNYLFIATSLGENSKPMTVFDQFDTPKVILFGNETHGLPNFILETADFELKIPINGIESLNLASAYAIFVYFLQKK